MASTLNKPDGNDDEEVFQKNLAIAVTALSIVADEINSFTDPETLRNYLLKSNARPKEEQERKAKAIVAMAKKLVNNPV